MDHQTQSFMDLSAIKDLAELIADTRAAWLWSADGAKVLWANAAGAAFFSARSVSDLENLKSFDRSPARPHLARIASSGFSDRLSIERLRFYRGLRVMLLTCQCKKIELENGASAALIISGDKGLATSNDPASAFAHMLGSSATTVYLTDDGKVKETIGTLGGTPEDLSLPDEQSALFGPLDLDGTFHDGVVLRISTNQKIVVLDNEQTSDALGDEPSNPADPENETVSAETPTEDESSSESDESLAPVLMSSPDTDVATGNVTDEIHDSNEAVEETDNADLSSDDAATVEVLPNEEDALEAEREESLLQDTENEIDASGDTGTAEDITKYGGEDASERAETTDGQSLDASSEETSEPDEFVFKPRRHPVRFAWKMDIEQRFTFLSDEFSEILGPSVTDIVGLTWAEVAEKYDLDPSASIGRALDRRDTWSGKTIDWPVSGAALRVPVDMAALPAFDRDRKFEGYRGFGVCRSADAHQDTEELSLSPAMAAFDESFAVEHAVDVSPDDTETEDPEEIESPDVSAVEESDAGDIETNPSADDTEPPAEDAAPVENSLEDLKPAQPNSLAGKTVIGASAAAVVGTLSKFSGGLEKNIEPPALAPSEDTIVPDIEDQAEAVNKDNLHEPVEAENDNKTAHPKEISADADQLEETIQQAASETDSDDVTPQEPEPAEEADLDVEDIQSEPSPPAALEESEIEAQDKSAEVWDETSSHDDEPVGISGSAPLDPTEIESAVKSLAKAYKATPQPSPDLFDEDKNEVSSEPEANQSSTDSDLTSDPEDKASEIAVDDDLFEPELRDDDTPDNKIAIVASDEPEAGQDNEPAETINVDQETDEREFFGETAAFEDEDKAAENGNTSSEEDEPVQRTGQVIPLVTARPRIVPVDTSGLSRPERQAFRKIAEALGARLEGDLEKFDEPDQEEEAFDELPPEVPEAGPIDPSLLDRLPIGIAIVNDREVLYGNKALLKLLGYNSIAALCEAGGLEALFIDDSDDLPSADGMDGEVDEPMKVRHADGGVRCVDAHMHSVPWNEARGLMISITERPSKAVQPEAPASPNFFAEVRSELDSAREQIAEMDTILETATDGVLILDEKGTIVKVNGSAEALFSANRVDMVGAPFTDFLAPESHRAAADYLDGLSRNGVASILNDGREVLGTVPSGGLIPLFMTMGRITGTKDEAKYCAVLRDITQWKTAEDELTQAKRQAENASSQKSDFLAKISHEIRTPLNAIIGFSEVMMEERFGAIGNDRYKDYLKDIRTSGSHIMSLINDLLDLSKIEAGKMDLKFSAVSTSEVINECVALMQPQANRERVIIRASLPDSVPNVVADPRSLRQIVLNLLSNAIKYNKSGGQVILSTVLEPNGEVALRVRDTGTGMTAKQLTAALEPFRQLHTASRGGGTGLGLPLTKALVEANRANFHIDSTPDQGTLVEVTFPTQRVLAE
ncbi:MAG: ATP-binding protein [Roseibium sp.]